MSDHEKDPSAALGDLDWDSALDEWEKNTFVPEIARDAESSHDASRLAAAQTDEPVPSEQPPTAPPPPSASAVPARFEPSSILDESPAEAFLRERPEEPPTVTRPLLPRGSTPSSRIDSTPAAPHSSRGGLHQLFSRPKAAPTSSSLAPRSPIQSALPLGGLRFDDPIGPASPSVPLRHSSAPPDFDDDGTLVDLGVVLPRPDADAPSVEVEVALPIADDEQVAADEQVVPGESTEEPFERVDAASLFGDIPFSGLAFDRAGSPAIADFGDDETAERPSARVVDDDGAPTVSTRALGSGAGAWSAPVDLGRYEENERARAALADAETATRLPDDEDDDDSPTISRRSSAPFRAAVVAPVLRQSTAPRQSAAPPAGPSTFAGERPVSRWHDEAKLAAFAARITWLEEEARAVLDPVARGRSLLAVSELCALVGDTDRACSFAVEARDAAPSLPLAWRQARQLMPRDPELLAEALDAEAASSPTPSARVHAVLLAADVLRGSGRGDGAAERWELACKLDPTDVRAPIARAALALAQNDHTSGALRLADNSELVAFDKAIGTALRLRGVERPGADVEPMPINDGLRHARLALAASDIVSAAQAAAEVATVPELANGALWLSASLGAAHIASRRSSARALKTLASAGDSLARRQLVARGIELGDPELVELGLADEASFDAAERSVLRVLATPNGRNADLASIAELSRDPGFAPLADALARTTVGGPGEEGEKDAQTRAAIVAGTDDARALATLGHLLAARSATSALDEALAGVREHATSSAAVHGVAIELAVRGRRWAELADALEHLPSSDDPVVATQRHVATALLAERAGDRDRAKDAWLEAARSSPLVADGLLRIAAEIDPGLDLGSELLRVADEMADGIHRALLRLEALARTDVGDDARIEILERVHRSAPELGIAAFLAEHVARGRGDVDEVVRWIQERRAYVTDPLEAALDAVREAFLVADRDPELASSRLEGAHRSRPDDVALRELHERLAPEPPADRGAWRQRRAESMHGRHAAVAWLEAALDHERAGDHAAALHASKQATLAGDRGLSGPLTLRSELALGETTGQTESLLELTRATDDIATRRDGFECLALLETVGKNDPAASVLWHRTILEETPLHKPSLRSIEHAWISEGREDELASIFDRIARALDGTVGGESTAHAQHAARLFARDAQSAGVEATFASQRAHEMALLASLQPTPSLWALRALNASARARKDDEALSSTTTALLERTHRPAERAALLLRASEAANRLGRLPEARALVEQASVEDPGDVVTWGMLAEMRQEAGEQIAAAEACENLARASVVKAHQLVAWYDAAKIWLDDVKDNERAMSALEAASELDVTHADVFPRLSALYAERNLDAELARLLEKRLDSVEDDDERVALEVELSHAFADMGELSKARTCLQSALTKRPDHTTALSALADLCLREADWAGAEQASVRLARLLSDPRDQRAIYERLGEIYSVHAPNFARAEVAFKEILKRAPGDLAILAKLVDVYKRQANAPRAIETQEEIALAKTDPNERLAALVELAKIHELVGKDPRKSERVLDSARKEFPTSVVALRSMAEFYARQRQMPAMQILLDRAAADARRAFAQGRFVPALFQVLHAAFELRGKRDAARVVAATLAAVEGQPATLEGAEARALDPRLDDLLAPELMSPALRALLARTGDTLDAVAGVDLGALKAVPLQPGTRIGKTVGAVATVVGLGALQILVSPHLGRVALPLSSNPPTLLVGEALGRVENEGARLFVVVRAMKMILGHASAMLRGQPQDVSGLVGGLFNALNPSFVPQGVDARRVSEMSRRIGPALPKSLDPTVGVIALEAAGMLGSSWTNLGPAAHVWANRVALLAVGDPSSALDAIAWSLDEEAAPTDPEERAAWIARNAEARELMTFSVTDAYAEARTRLGIDR